MPRYVNPFTDFGFKKIFGEEANKPILLDFLNALLPPHDRIRDLTFRNPEQRGATALERRSIFDIYCENERGERIIVELQKAQQYFFKDRMVFYSTFPIREQANRGDWDYSLKAVYCVGILDFRFNDPTDQARDEVRHEVKLKNQHGEVFYDKLTYIYLEMPNFHKTEAELTTRLDQWLYFIKHLEDFDRIPHIFRESVFVQAFEQAAIARFEPDEMDSYEYSLKNYRDWYAITKYALEEGTRQAIAKSLQEGIEKGLQEGRQEGIEQGIEQGLQQGIQQGIQQVARNLKAGGVVPALIAQATGLTEAEIAAL